MLRNYRYSHGYQLHEKWVTKSGIKTAVAVAVVAVVVKMKERKRDQRNLRNPRSLSTRKREEMTQEEKYWRWEI